MARLEKKPKRDAWQTMNAAELSQLLHWRLSGSRHVLPKAYHLSSK